MLKTGVRIFEWPEEMMHGKTAVIDDSWAIVGSYNFDHRSLFHNLESAVVIADHSFSKKLREQTISDIARCQEITLETLIKKKISEKILETMAYFLRKWL
jgi:cardiolipin synthase